MSAERIAIDVLLMSAEILRFLCWITDQLLIGNDWKWSQPVRPCQQIGRKGMSREVKAMTDDRSTECWVLYVRASQLRVDGR
jgi:hypothetical protein